MIEKRRERTEGYVCGVCEARGERAEEANEGKDQWCAREHNFWSIMTLGKLINLCETLIVYP